MCVNVQCKGFVVDNTDDGLCVVLFLRTGSLALVGSLAHLRCI